LGIDAVTIEIGGGGPSSPSFPLVTAVFKACRQGTANTVDCAPSWCLHVTRHTYLRAVLLETQDLRVLFCGIWDGACWA